MKFQNVMPVIFFALALCCSSANADFLTFDLEWTGLNDGATATGLVTIDDDVLPNPSPGGAIVLFADLGITDFEITISGAAGGNGTFGLGDFAGAVWGTEGVALDLSTELVGQSTTGGPWGTPDGFSGDFNVFAANPSAPTGVFFFTLATNGGAGSILELTAFTPQAIPEPSAFALMATLASIAIVRRRK